MQLNGHGIVKTSKYHLVTRLTNCEICANERVEFDAMRKGKLEWGLKTHGKSFKKLQQMVQQVTFAYSFLYTFCGTTSIFLICKMNYENICLSLMKHL